MHGICFRLSINLFVINANAHIHVRTFTFILVIYIFSLGDILFFIFMVLSSWHGSAAYGGVEQYIVPGCFSDLFKFIFLFK